MYPIELLDSTLLVESVGYARSVGECIDVPCVGLCAVVEECEAEVLLKGAVVLLALL